MHVQPGVADDFIRDLKEGVRVCMKNPDKKIDGIGVIYGLAQSIPDRSIVSDIARLYLDGLYQTK